ncbi:fimbrial protein, partial [Pseudomonas syringae pv. syringae FF5]
MEWRKEVNKGAIAQCALPHPRRCALGIGFGLTLMFVLNASAASSGSDGAARFNTAFIQGSDQPADLQEFLRSNSVLPGTYRVDIYVNRKLSGRRDIRFLKNPLSGLIEPCLSLEMLQSFGLDLSRLPSGEVSAQACFDLPARVEFARVDYQPGALRLTISVPQAVMSRGTRGYVAPELWDQGETAGFIN